MSSDSDDDCYCGSYYGHGYSYGYHGCLEDCYYNGNDDTSDSDDDIGHGHRYRQLGGFYLDQKVPAPSQLKTEKKKASWEDEITEDCSRELVIDSSLCLGRDRPASPPPQPVKNEKKVVCWEDKVTGGYSRVTVTEKTVPGEGEVYQRYRTFTAGNRFTGESSTRQDREVRELKGTSGGGTAAIEGAVGLLTSTRGPRSLE